LFDANGDGDVERLLLHLVDGLRGDSDLAADGVVRDPGGPATVLAPIAPKIDRVIINDGHAQRSKINSITVNFDSVVSLNPGAFELIHESGVRIALEIATSVIDGRTAAALTFRGNWIVGGSLFNGDYTLVVHADKIRSQAGAALDGDNDGTAGGNHRAEFFRRFGDSDGDGEVDRVDRGEFFSTLLKRAGNPDYLWYFDWDDDGRVAVIDLLAFTVASLGPHR
jgi:hypothetical protein